MQLISIESLVLTAAMPIGERVAGIVTEGDRGAMRQRFISDESAMSQR